MPALTDEQLVEALSENGHADEAEALAEKIGDDDTEGPVEKSKPKGFGDAMRSTRR